MTIRSELPEEVLMLRERTTWAPPIACPVWMSRSHVASSSNLSKLVPREAGEGKMITSRALEQPSCAAALSLLPIEVAVRLRMWLFRSCPSLIAMVGEQSSRRGVEGGQISLFTSDRVEPPLRARIFGTTC